MNNAFGLIFVIKVHIEQLLKPRPNYLPGEITLEQFLEPRLSSESLEILEFVYKHVDSFEEIAKTTIQTDLQRAISSEVEELRVIVSRISNWVRFSKEEVEDLKERFYSFTRRLKMEEQRCADGLYNTFPDDDEDEEDNWRDAAVTSKMIGACDVYEQLKQRVMSERNHLTSLVGMPGIGKTTLAKKLFNDPTILQRFDHRVWIRVGKKYRLKDIPRRILAEIDPDSLPGIDDEEAVHEYLKEILANKSYLIVLDDVWDKYINTLWGNSRYKFQNLKHPFLEWQSDQSRILATSRLQQLSGSQRRLDAFSGVVATRLLNKEESWDLLCDEVFRCKGLSCPPQLVKAGKKISKKCEGLPLTILTVARLLSQAEKTTPEYWNEVAVKKNHRLFMNAYDEISKVLLPSYTYLPPLLKLCFLYIGLFPQDYEIPRCKLINLWLSDRFLELNININSDFEAIDCLEELVSNSLVMVYKKSTRNAYYTVKTCGLHSSLWHLANRKSRETKFALILSSPDDCLGDDMKVHPRLSIHSNVLFAMKDVHKSVEENCASTTRSLLCFGPYHRYQVPLCFHLKLLRELDALSIRFYAFPMEVLQLVRLAYLSLTLNGIIPSSIYQLQYLEFFIVDKHQSIKSCNDTSYLPVEIWMLPKLKHLQVMGIDLPDPHGASLDSLSTLSKVSARSCTDVVLKGVPNLRELNIQIELLPDADGKPFTCFAHISHLSKLESLKCVIVNPGVVPPVIPFSCFPKDCLKKLCLSGLSYPWKEMGKIASLPSLKVLKLKHYAFQGPYWEVEEAGFFELDSLVIEDTDLMHWQFGVGAFSNLRSLIIKNCYKLEKIRGEFKVYLYKVEIVDCNPSCVEEIKKAIPKKAVICVIDVHSSWDDRKLKRNSRPSPSKR